MSHISKSTLIIAFFFAIDKVFAFGRQILVARAFGLSYELDVFNAANNIPDLLSALISCGALGVALIPVLSEYLETRGRNDAWELFSQILNLAFIVTGALALFIALFAAPLVNYVIVPDFPEPQRLLTIELMRLDLAAIMIFSLSGLIMAGLQANQHFTLPALAPLLYNVGQIFGIMILAPAEGFSLGPVTLPGFGLGIHGLVYGVIIGAVLHLAIQIPGLIRYNFHWTPRLKLKEPGVQKVLSLLAPRVATMFFIQMFFIMRDNLASGLGEGAVSALNYGWFIMQVPETLLGTAIAIAILPTLAEHITRQDQTAFRDTVNRAVRVIFALTIPVAALLAAGVEPLISILDFDPQATRMVVLATRGYLLGLAGHALLEIASRSFYARQDARTPLIAAAINAVMYIGFAILFSRLWGSTGIAIANSLAFTLEATLLFVLLRRQAPGVFNIKPALVRVVLGTATATLTVISVLYLLPLDTWGSLMTTAGAAGALVVGGLVLLPFIRQELKLLIKI